MRTLCRRQRKCSICRFAHDLFLKDVHLNYLQSIVETEITSSVPVLLCSVPGYDASGRVEDLATEMNRPVTSIAIGSAEGFAQADQVEGISFVSL